MIAKARSSRSLGLCGYHGPDMAFYRPGTAANAVDLRLTGGR